MTNDGISDFFEYMIAVQEYAIRCWKNRGGKFEVIVFEEHDKIHGSIKGGHNWKSRRGGDDE
jgi:hypothetical protein